MSRVIYSRTFRGAVTVIVLGLFLLKGRLLIEQPIICYGIIGLSLGVLTITFETYILLIAVFFAAMFSRVFVYMGLPGVLNFAHFPLIIAAAYNAIVRKGPKSKFTHGLEIGIVLLLGISIISGFVNKASILKSILLWLTFCEPFIFLYAICRTPLTETQKRFLWNIFYGYLVVYVPICFMQYFTGFFSTRPVGHGDIIQGTFTGMEASAHVSGAVALVYILMFMAKIVLSDDATKRTRWILVSMPLLVISILTDAKQCIIAFIPACFLLICAFSSFPAKKRAIIGATMLIGIVILFNVDLPGKTLEKARQDAIVGYGGTAGGLDSILLRKWTGFQIAMEAFDSTSMGWMLGVGPGMGGSRVAFEALTGGKAGSAIRKLNLKESPLTKDIWQIDYYSSRSSLYTGISSWLGIFGDLGLIGLLIYVWLWWQIWHSIGSNEGWKAGAIKSTIVMTLVLGALFNWLEEPNYMCFVAFLVGLAVKSGEEPEIEGEVYERG